MSAPGASAGGTRGRWLVAARVVWIFVALAGVAITFASAPILFEQYATPCMETPERCLEFLRFTPEGSRVLEGAGLSLRLYAASGVGAFVLSALVWVAVGALLFLLRSGDRIALLVSFFLVAFGTATINSDAVDALAVVHPAWLVLGRGVQVLGEVFVVLFFLTFPDGRFVPRWTRWLGAAFLAFQIPGDLFPGSYSSLPALEIAQGVAFICFVLGMLGSQIYRYRVVSTPSQRRQTRWVVSGTTLAMLSLLVVFLPFLILGPRLAEVPPLVLAPILAFNPFITTLIPLSVGVAMLRSGLFDIDAAINRALVYGTLTLALAAVYVGGVVGLQYLLRTLSGQGSTLAVVASTLAIAALFVPLRRRIQGFIDRRFYRKKYDAAKTLEAFSVRLRAETDLDTLSSELVNVVRDTVQPRHVSLWLRPVERRDR